MRHLAITIATAVLVVGVFLLLRTTRSGRSELREPPVVALARDLAARKPDTRAASIGFSEGAVITGTTELEALHRKHGKAGDAMRDFLALAVGTNWNLVDRARMQEVLHALRFSITENDIPYLLDLFARTKDPSFRWWFSWAVWQIEQELGERFPGDQFVEPMTEVYALDKARGFEALATIDRPLAMDRFSKLLDAETDPDMRTYAINAFARSVWDGKEDFLVKLARDGERVGLDRFAAINEIGHVGTASDANLGMLFDLAGGPAVPVTGLKGGLAASHPIADLRSAAVLAVMQLGDQETVRRLMDAADRAGPDSDLTKIIDGHLGSFSGPDLTEIVWDRARRRRYLSPGELQHLIRDPDRIDRARLRDLLPFIRDEETRKRAQTIIGQ